MMRKIEAVKIIRAHTGSGLLEAKKAMDEIVEKGCLADPEGESERSEASKAAERQLRDDFYNLRIELDKANDKIVTLRSVVRMLSEVV